MSELYQRLSHSKWDCKYHIVFVPKRRRKVIFEQTRRIARPSNNTETQRRTASRVILQYNNVGRCIACLPWILAPQLSGISGGADDGGSAEGAWNRRLLGYRLVADTVKFCRVQFAHMLMVSRSPVYNRRRDKHLEFGDQIRVSAGLRKQACALLEHLWRSIAPQIATDHKTTARQTMRQAYTTHKYLLNSAHEMVGKRFYLAVEAHFGSRQGDGLRAETGWHCRHRSAGGYRRHADGPSLAAGVDIVAGGHRRGTADNAGSSNLAHNGRARR
jgi:hypothetical protein